MSSLKEYVDKLFGDDEAERIYAAEDIGYLNAADGVPSLLERLGQESSQAVRGAIFQALTRIDKDAAIEGCIGLLRNDDPRIRNQAVEVLRCKGAASFPFLQTVMREGDKDLRKLVLDVLIGIQVSAPKDSHAAGTDTSIGARTAEGTAEGTSEIYEAALSDEDQNVIITAVENIGKTRALQFRCRIEELLLGNRHPMLVGACLEALAGIGSEQSLAVIRRRFPDLAAVPDLFLASCLKAIGALGTTGEFIEVAGLLAVRAPHHRPAILSALNAINQRHPTQVHDSRLLPVLQAMIEDGGSPLYRYQAVRALRYLASGDDVYSFLVSCLSNSERLVRLGAIESLRVTARAGLAIVLSSFALDETDEEVLQALSC